MINENSGKQWVRFEVEYECRKIDIAFEAFLNEIATDNYYEGLEHECLDGHMQRHGINTNSRNYRGWLQGMLETNY